MSCAAQRLTENISANTARPTYDNLGRVTYVNSPAPQLDVATAYYNFGRVVSVSQSGHALSYAYDQLGRLTSETGPRGTISYLYDVAGRRTRTKPAFGGDVQGGFTNWARAPLPQEDGVSYCAPGAAFVWGWVPDNALRAFLGTGVCVQAANRPPPPPLRGPLPRKRGRN